MPTATELNQYRNAILAYERSQSSFPALAVQPEILETTAKWNSLQYPAVTNGVTQIMFNENTSHKLFMLLIVTGTVVGLYVRYIHVNLPFWLQILIAFLLAIAVLIVFWRLLKPDPKIFISMNTATIDISGTVYRWDEMMETFIMRRRGSYETFKLVLLLKNGDVKVFELKYYKAINVSRSIEHFRNP